MATQIEVQDAIIALLQLNQPTITFGSGGLTISLNGQTVTIPNTPVNGSGNVVRLR